MRKRITYLFVYLFNYLFNYGQVNLVPNPSFEDTIGNNCFVQMLMLQPNSVGGYAYYYLDSIALYHNNNPTTIIEIEPKRSFNLFPNPNNGSMTMIYDLGKDSNASMNLYDVTGKLINSYDLQNTNGTIEINETQLGNGIYFYRILVNGITINTNKIVIIK